MGPFSNAGAKVRILFQKSYNVYLGSFYCYKNFCHAELAEASLPLR
jgi:hypothetical protein